jgi:excisionase family DNA binding protein
MTRLTVKETADYLRLSHSTLEAWRTKGRGPRFAKLGKKVFYDTRDLDKWIDDNMRNSTSDKPQLRRRRRRSRVNNLVDVNR